MGQSKRNPIAIAAKKGELPPKPVKIGKREAERLLRAQVAQELFDRTGISPEIICTHKPVKIADAKSGLIRKLIDVSPNKMKMEKHHD